jgi:hypothetical protein
MACQKLSIQRCIHGIFSLAAKSLCSGRQTIRHSWPTGRPSSRLEAHSAADLPSIGLSTRVLSDPTSIHGGHLDGVLTSCSLS